MRSSVVLDSESEVKRQNIQRRRFRSQTEKWSEFRHKTRTGGEKNGGKTVSIRLPVENKEREEN